MWSGGDARVGDETGIRLHLTGLSLSDTVSILGESGVDRCRTTVNSCMQRGDLQPLDGANAEHVAGDETEQLNDDIVCTPLRARDELPASYSAVFDEKHRTLSDFLTEL